MITTDTGAKKWENSDNWRQIYQAHNESVDAEDAAIAALQDGLAIVANGNTHAAIAAGQFVFVKNHDTLATGLYTASAAIAANATLSGSNLTADASGGLNALNSNIAKFTKSVVYETNFTVPANTNTILIGAISTLTGNVVTANNLKGMCVTMPGIALTGLVDSNRYNAYVYVVVPPSVSVTNKISVIFFYE